MSKKEEGMNVEGAVKYMKQIEKDILCAEAEDRQIRVRDGGHKRFQQALSVLSQDSSIERLERLIKKSPKQSIAISISDEKGYDYEIEEVKLLDSYNIKVFKGTLAEAINNIKEE